MAELSTQEKSFKINGLEYHVNLIPTKSRNSQQTRSILEKIAMVFTNTYYFEKTNGIVQCSKKTIGSCSLENFEKDEEIGTFQETLAKKEGVNHYQLIINLTKEHPKKQIIIYGSHYDTGNLSESATLISGRGRKRKITKLE